MNSTTRNILLFILAVVVAALLYLNMTRERDPRPTVVVGVSAFQDTILPLYSKRKGFLSGQNYDFEFQVVGWTEVLEGLSNQTNSGLDVGVNNICSIVGAWPGNNDLVYYYPLNPFDDGFALMTRPENGIEALDHFLELGLSRKDAIVQTAAQLRGRTIVTTSNTDMEQGVAAAARTAGLNFDEDLEIVNLPPDEGLIAFLQGTGDFYIGGIPQRFKAKQDGMIEVLTGVDLGPAPINGLVTTRSFASANPDALQELIEAWFETITYIDENLDEASEEIISLVNANTAGQLTADDFKFTWNELESFMASPAQVEAEILAPSGRNFWVARWNDCNTYFTDIANTADDTVPIGKASLVEDVHQSVVRNTQ